MRVSQWLAPNFFEIWHTEILSLNKSYGLVKLLLIEDNKQLAEDVAMFFGEEGYITETALTLGKAREKLGIYHYELVILDLGMPDGNGLDLIPVVQGEHPRTAILVLTARDSLDEKVHALEQGADDYLTKPFHKSELNARVHSILRRRISGGSSHITINELTIDLGARIASVKDVVLNLTRKEYDLLLFLVYNKNRLLTKESIAEHLWGDHIDQADNFDFIYNHIKNLRRKIKQAGGRNYIESMYGMGYKLVTDPT